jgi:hypothetical protein
MKEKQHRSHGEAKGRRKMLADYRRKDVIDGEELTRQIGKAQQRLDKIQGLLGKDEINSREKALLKAEGIYIKRALGRLNMNEASQEMEGMLKELSVDDRNWLESGSKEDRFTTNLQKRRGEVISVITGRLDIKN